MDYKMPLIILAIVAVLLLGKGITGFVVISQSCCMPGTLGCEGESVCGLEEQNSKTDNISLVVFGSLIMLATLFVYRAYHKHEVY
ncbi:hypothetical protein KY311_02205 [Candidatus Woesearchaeota archaeon]|nr:hypothetical protein [Candidatus Woesearchaeota archaeon]